MTQKDQPTVQEITRRAYALYLERGGKHGNDVEDWLKAERELSEPVAKVAKAKATASR